MTSENFLTKEGLVKLKKEVEERKTIRRKEITYRIGEAIKLGDLSENAEYHEAKDDQGMNEAKIRELENIIKTAIIIEKGNKDCVNLGCTIKVRINDIEKEFTLVGASEADPLQGLISNESPLGEAFLGKRVGEIAEVDAPVGKVKYKIIAIG
jgi:transcription elongation factor GreA